PVIPTISKELFPALRSRGIHALATTVYGGTPAGQLDLSQPIALFIGNEGNGLSSDLISQCDDRITIPCPGPVESLNAAIAASILLYEASRQRQT
ncbi:MAG TPA: RNA methyltransferase, partial [Alloacidobacterium sp.]|nr:RNA methyltransferase [Alloacidobacterium sp.]